MFYSNLKSICDEKGVKITSLVLECGGTKGIIGGWKKGTSPNSDIVMKIAIKLNSTDILLFGEERYNRTNISHSTIGAFGNHSHGTVTMSTGLTATETKSESNVKPEQDMSDITKEIVKISENLPMKEQVRLLNMIYDFEEQYKKLNT